MKLQEKNLQLSLVFMCTYGFNFTCQTFFPGDIVLTDIYKVIAFGKIEITKSGANIVGYSMDK